MWWENVWIACALALIALTFYLQQSPNVDTVDIPNRNYIQCEIDGKHQNQLLSPRVHFIIYSVLFILEPNDWPCICVFDFCVWQNEICYFYVNKHFVINFEWHRHFKADEFTIILFEFLFIKFISSILTRSLKLIWGVEKFRSKFFSSLKSQIRFSQQTNLHSNIQSFLERNLMQIKNNQCTLMASLTIPFDRKEFAPFICSTWSKSNSYYFRKTTTKYLIKCHKWEFCFH